LPLSQATKAALSESVAAESSVPNIASCKQEHLPVASQVFLRTGKSRVSEGSLIPVPVVAPPSASEDEPPPPVTVPEPPAPRNAVELSLEPALHASRVTRLDATTTSEEKRKVMRWIPISRKVRWPTWNRLRNRLSNHEIEPHDTPHFARQNCDRPGLSRHRWRRSPECGVHVGQGMPACLARACCRAAWRAVREAQPFSVVCGAPSSGGSARRNAERRTRGRRSSRCVCPDPAFRESARN
jgi:hypothetical protein